MNIYTFDPFICSTKICAKYPIQDVQAFPFCFMAVVSYIKVSMQLCERAS